MTIITKKNKSDIKAIIWALKWEIKEIRETADIAKIEEKDRFCYVNIGSLTKMLERDIERLEAYL